MAGHATYDWHIFDPLFDGHGDHDRLEAVLREKEHEGLRRKRTHPWRRTGSRDSRESGGGGHTGRSWPKRFMKNQVGNAGFEMNWKRELNMFQKMG